MSDIPSYVITLFSVGLFSYLTFHGGLCLNSRYFYFVLPFTSILCAYAWADISRSYKPRHPVRLAIATAFFAATLYFILSKWLFTSLNGQEFHQLRVPLFISVVLLLMVICLIWGSQALRRGVIPFLWVGLIFAFVWSGMVAFFYDYPQHRAQRQRNDMVGSITANLIQPNSIVFLTIYPDSFANLIDKDKIRLARPREDKFRDFPALLQFHLDRQRPVYGIFILREWNALLKGPLKNHVVHPIWSFKGGSSKKLEIISLGPYEKVPVQDIRRGVMLGRIALPSDSKSKPGE